MQLKHLRSSGRSESAALDGHFQSTHFPFKRFNREVQRGDGISRRFFATQHLRRQAQHEDDGEVPVVRVARNGDCEVKSARWKRLKFTLKFGNLGTKTS